MNLLFYEMKLASELKGQKEFDLFIFQVTEERRIWKNNLNIAFIDEKARDEMTKIFF